MTKQANPCVSCYYARMKKDVCGIYCTGGFATKDGKCDRWKFYKERKKKSERTLQKQGFHGQTAVC